MFNTHPGREHEFKPTPAQIKLMEAEDGVTISAGSSKFFTHPELFEGPAGVPDQPKPTPARKAKRKKPTKSKSD